MCACNIFRFPNFGKGVKFSIFLDVDTIFFNFKGFNFKGLDVENFVFQTFGF